MVTFLSRYFKPSADFRMKKSYVRVDLLGEMTENLKSFMNLKIMSKGCFDYNFLEKKEAGKGRCPEQNFF